MMSTDSSNKSIGTESQVSPSNSSQQIHYSPVQQHLQSPQRIPSPTPRTVTSHEGNSTLSRETGTSRAIEHILQPPVGILDYSNTPVISNINLNKDLNDDKILCTFDNDVNMDDILLVNVGDDNHHMEEEDKGDGCLFSKSLDQSRSSMLSKPAEAFRKGMRIQSVGLLDVESMKSHYKSLQDNNSIGEENRDVCHETFNAEGNNLFNLDSAAPPISRTMLDVSLRSMEGGRSTSRRKLGLGPRRAGQLQVADDLSTPLSLELPLQISGKNDLTNHDKGEECSRTRHESFSDSNPFDTDQHMLENELSPELNFFPHLRLSRPEDASSLLPASIQYQPQRQDSLLDVGLSSRTENLDSIFCRSHASFDDVEDDDSSSARYLIRPTVSYSEGVISTKWGMPSLRRAHHLRSGGDCYSCTTDTLTEASCSSIQESFTTDTNSVINAAESRDEEEEQPKSGKSTLLLNEPISVDTFDRVCDTKVTTSSSNGTAYINAKQGSLQEQIPFSASRFQRDAHNFARSTISSASSSEKVDERKLPSKKVTETGGSRRRLKDQKALDWLREIRLKENSVGEAASSKFLRTNHNTAGKEVASRMNGAMTSSTSMLNVFDVMSHNRQESVSS